MSAVSSPGTPRKSDKSYEGKGLLLPACCRVVKEID